MPLSPRDMERLQACWRLCCERLARERTRVSVEDPHPTLRLMFEAAIQALAVSDSLQALRRRYSSRDGGEPPRYLAVDVYEDGRGMIARAEIPTDYGRPDMYEFGWRPRGRDRTFEASYMSNPYTVSASEINYARARPVSPSLISERDRMMREMAEMQAIPAHLFENAFPSLNPTPKPPPPFVPPAALEVQRENEERRRALDAHVERCQLAMYLLRRLISDAIYIMWHYQLDDFTKRCFLAAEERELIPRPTPDDPPPDELPIDTREWVPFGTSGLTREGSAHARALLEKYAPPPQPVELEME